MNLFIDIQIIRQLNFNLNMMYLQENNRLLQTILTRMNQQIKKVIKFSKHKFSEQEMTSQCIDHLNNYRKISASQDNKENICINLNSEEKSNGTDDQKFKNEKKERLEKQLNKRFFMNFNKEKIQTSASLHQSQQNTYTNRFPLVPMISSINSSQNILTNVPMTTSLVYPQPPKNSLYSSTQKNNIQSTKRHNLIHSSSELEADNSHKCSRQKSSTYSKLRKVQQFFCAPSPSKKLLKKRISNAEQYLLANIDTEKEAMIEQNKSLKAIQSNLITHLNLLQKHKHVPSLDTLIEKQQALKKKQTSLRDLQDKLIKRQLKINKTHCEVIKRQKSLKML